MASEIDHTLTWIVQTVLVWAVVLAVGGLLGVDYLFVEFGSEAESFRRIVLFLVLAAGSVFFLLVQVSKMIDERIEESRGSDGAPAE